MADLYSAWTNSGPTDRLQDEQKSILNQLSMQEAAGRIAEQPARQRILGAEAGAQELKLSNEQRMQKILQDASNPTGPAGPAALPAIGPDGQPVSTNPASDVMSGLSRQLGTKAAALARAGFVNEAAGLTEKLSLIDSHRATASAAVSRQANSEFDLAHKNLGIAVGLLHHVKDLPPEQREQEWQRAHSMFTVLTGKRSSFADLPYSEENLKLAEGAVLSAKDQLELEDKDTKNALTAARDADRKTYQDAQVAASNARVSIMRQRLAMNKKAGSAAAKFPTTGELGLGMSAIQQYMEENDLGKLSPGALNTAAAVIVGDAKALLKANPGLSTPMAMQQSLDMHAKDFEKGDEGYAFGFGATPSKFKLSGGTKPPAEKPPEKPASNLPPVDAKGWKLKVDAKGNKAYVGPNNEIREVQ